MNIYGFDRDAWLRSLSRSRVEEELACNDLAAADRVRIQLARGVHLSEALRAEPSVRIGDRVVPRTSLEALYGQMKLKAEDREGDALLEERRCILEGYDSDAIARLFADSVGEFSAYCLSEPHPFHGPRSDETVPLAYEEASSRLKATAWIQERGGLEVEGASHLSADYVTRELPPANTPGGVVFRGRPGHEPLAIDLLLARRAEPRRPIVGEVKQRGDSDPAYALIQALAYAAQIVTEPQRARLKEFRPESYEVAEAGPAIDIYVVLFDWIGRVGRSAPLSALSEQASTLAEELVRDDRVAAHIERIECIQIDVDEDRAVAGWPGI